MHRIAFVATFVIIAGSAALLASPRSAEGKRWGAEGHQMIGQVAAERLPAAMPTFFRAAAPQLAWLNVEPDRWRVPRDSSLDRAFGAYAAEHYINLETIPANALRAPDRHAFSDSLAGTGRNAARNGLALFTVLELTDRVRVGFRLWRNASSYHERRYLEERIINDAGILGHYVADLANPHHTTIHHDGWVGDNPRNFTTGRGFHWRFEGEYVRANLRMGDFANLVAAPARTLVPLRDSLLAYVQRSHAQVERLYELDVAERFGPATRSATHRRFTAERLAAGAEMLRDVWWTAWVTSE